MAEDDVVDEVQGVTTMAMTSGARAAEVLLRASQDRAVREAHEQREHSQDAHRRYEAQAASAEAFYRRASEADFIREQPQDVVVQAWHGAQEWRDLDPDRFAAHAEQINAQIKTEYDIDLHEAADRLGDRSLAADLGEMKIQQTRGVDEDERDAAQPSDEAGLADGRAWDDPASRRAREAQLNQADLPEEVRHAVRVVEHQRGTDPALAASAGAGSTAGASRGKARGRGRGRGETLGR